MVLCNGHIFSFIPQLLSTVQSFVLLSAAQKRPYDIRGPRQKRGATPAITIAFAELISFSSVGPFKAHRTIPMYGKL
ncbi:hypothetical protein CHS0354_037878, partial [Potamilus streckersoni]